VVQSSHNAMFPGLTADADADILALMAPLDFKQGTVSAGGGQVLPDGSGNPAVGAIPPAYPQNLCATYLPNQIQWANRAFTVGV